ncbi:ABC transporter substrate-binding protein [Ureibacillus thermosphaericus]|uniref:ABC transporter substrate-binding protein n=1 Tax=Ureibacillus thermosphaericus TaxID=51173 RepID=UPI0030C99EA7
MKMKKWLGLAATAMLTLGLVACQSNEKAKEEDTNANNSTNAPVEIEFWYGLGSVAGETMEGIIQDFNESQDDVIVTGVQQASYSETFQKLQAAVASKTAPGVFLADLPTIHYLASNKIITSIDKYVAEDSIFDENDFLDVFISPAKIDGSLYALPAYGTTQVMYYRKDIFEQAGIDPNEAYASWENIAKSSKQLQEHGLEYGHLPMWGRGNLIDIALSNGGTILNEDGTEVMIDSPEWIEAWEFIRKNIHEDKTMKVNSGGQGWEYWYRTIDDVLNGAAGGYTGSSGDKGDLDFSIIDSAPQPGLGGNPGKPMVESLFMAIPDSINDEEKDAAYKWISYFTSADVNAYWSKTTGYIPVRQSTMDVPEYKQFIEENPYAAVPYNQALTGTPGFVDPTGGKILDAISIAADKVELENVSAEEALKEAKEAAQKALDKEIGK